MTQLIQVSVLSVVLEVSVKRLERDRVVLCVIGWSKRKGTGSRGTRPYPYGSTTVYVYMGEHYLSGTAYVKATGDDSNGYWSGRTHFSVPGFFGEFRISRYQKLCWAYCVSSLLCDPSSFTSQWGCVMQLQTGRTKRTGNHFNFIKTILNKRFKVGPVRQVTLYL